MRLFIAIKPDRHSVDRIVEVISHLMEMSLPVKWVKRDNIHLTLKFLGDKSANESKRIVSALQRISTQRSFDLLLKGIGTFRRNNSPKVIWMGTGWSEGLNQLFLQIESQLYAMGIPKERYKLSPHITIGRVKRNFVSGKFEKYLKSNGTSLFSKFRVDSFYLIKSDLFPGGPVYSDVSRIVLKDERDLNKTNYS